MRKVMFILLVSLYFTVPTHALTFDTLPVKQTSEQWSVKVGEAEETKDGAKPEKGKFHTYSLRINNIGEDVNSVEVNIYRNEPGSTTKYSLVGCPDEKDCHPNRYEEAMGLARQLNKDNPYLFRNFLLAEKATELEVEIVWTSKEHPGRPLKETFVFKE
ncbi:hypothetical protein [Metabacillus rhizolycopersici]|uniref:Lipoprotein n=1 Tax=Metabacillus rhizolycopersici TaxID=2875709 RepID=A0ABS7UTM0_9BACI|nr:hypothetical protein [Metabacillus rhizolycopersici]MBZ5751315.1 hypothetical protein [Metabacillus rhizolycopersici]